MTYQRVNGYSVVAEMRDATSPTAQSIVVCQQCYGGDYVVWTVRQWGGETEAMNGHYDISDYARALAIAASRATGEQVVCWRSEPMPPILEGE